MTLPKEIAKAGFDENLPIVELPAGFIEILKSTKGQPLTGPDEHEEVMATLKNGSVSGPHSVVVLLEDGRIFAQRRDPASHHELADFVSTAVYYTEHPDVGDLNVELWANRPEGNNIMRDGKEVKKVPAGKTSKKAKK